MKPFEVFQNSKYPSTKYHEKQNDGLAVTWKGIEGRSVWFSLSENVL